MLSSRVKIWSFRGKAHLVFHWCLFNKLYYNLAQYRCNDYRNRGKLWLCIPLYPLRTSVLSLKFEVGVSLLLAPTGGDKRSPKASFPLVENAGIQPAIYKRVPAGAPAGAGSYWVGLTLFSPMFQRDLWTLRNNSVLDVHYKTVHES